jgi:hypothetical protein
MDMSFSNLKRSGASLTEKLQKQLDKQVNGSYKDQDDRFWKPTKDQNGNAYAVIRFLPPAPDKESESGMEEDFYIRLYSHSFKGPTGKYYIENSLTSIGDKDPVGEYNSVLWNRGTETAKKQASVQKRKTHFISNIFVIEDSANPSNNGKVFLYKYGKKIFEKINDRMNPKFKDEKAMNPFDFWEGANFKLKMTQVEDFPNYDKSEFSSESALVDGDDTKIEAIWNKQYPLRQFLDKSQFKTFAQLKARLAEVVPETASEVRQHVEDNDDEEVVTTPTRTKISNSPAPQAETSAGDMDDDDEIEFFKKLATG